MLKIGKKDGFLHTYLQNKVKVEWEYTGFLDLLWTVYIYLA